MTNHAECLYDADRARVEAVRAIEADSPVVAAIHQEMCLRYCGQVIAAMLTARLVR